MKKLLVFLFTILVGTAFAHTIEWYVGDSVYDTTTCSSGDNITPPTAPAKYGYHFAEWWPMLYKELEYIESTGTQYIDTGKNFASDVKIYMETMYLSPLSSYGWGRNAGSQEILWQNNMFYFGGGYSSTSQKVIDTKYAYDLDFTAGAMVAKINGAVVRETTNIYNASFANRIYLFALNSYGNNIEEYSGRVYGFKYVNGSTLEQNLVPAKRISDNAIGMYDTVTDTFFENAGTGEFIAGPEVDGL